MRSLQLEVKKEKHSPCPQLKWEIKIIYGVHLQNLVYHLSIRNQNLKRGAYFLEIQSEFPADLQAKQKIHLKWGKTAMPQNFILSHYMPKHRHQNPLKRWGGFTDMKGMNHQLMKAKSTKHKQSLWISCSLKLDTNHCHL